MKQITKAEHNSKLEKPDPNRPARDLSSESQHVNKDSQKPSCGGVRAHHWKWVLHHLCKSYTKTQYLHWGSNIRSVTLVLCSVGLHSIVSDPQLYYKYNIDHVKISYSNKYSNVSKVAFHTLKCYWRALFLLFLFTPINTKIGVSCQFSWNLKGKYYFNVTTETRLLFKERKKQQVMHWRVCRFIANIKTKIV